jgi:ankyrin repeat protein
MAAEYGRADFVELLASDFKYSVNVIAHGSKNNVRKGRSALHLAVHYGHMETVQKLLTLKADPDIRDKKLQKTVDMIIHGIQG